MPKRPRTPKDAAAFVDDALASWRVDLIKNADGFPKALLANAITALRYAPEWQGILAFDAFRQETMLQGKAPWMTDPVNEAWSDNHDILTADWLQHQSISVSPDVTAQAVQAVAQDKRFHPVLDYLAGCVWDNTARLDEWAITHLGAPDTPYVRAVSAKWMIAAVARVHVPGCKADTALILEGYQGLLKSSALGVLAKPWFTDEIADLGSKDSAMQLAGVWIIELGELDSMSRPEVGKIKAFMSRARDRYRPSYGRRVIEQPRQCIFGGTVNGNQYLRDETGGRRFWPIICTLIDLAGLAKVRDQLWAEACHRYQAGEKWWLDDKDLTDAATKEQRGRLLEDAWNENIKKYIDAKEHVSVAQVLRDAIKMDVKEWTQNDMNRVARCLIALGWERRQARLTKWEREALKAEGKEIDREWRYYPPEPARVSALRVVER